MNSHAAPTDLEYLTAAADREVEAVPARRTLTQLAVASVVAVVVVVALLLVSIFWIQSAADDAAIGTECSGPSCVEVPLAQLAIADRVPAGTTVVASNRYTRLFDQFVYFEVRMPAGSQLPELAEPWTNEETDGELNSNAERMAGRGYTAVHWAGDFAAGTDDDGTIILVGSYLSSSG